MATKKQTTGVAGYTGALARRVVWLRPKGFANKADYEAAAMQRFAEQTDPKWQLLAEHHGVAWDDPNRWTLLCVALARAHVPGFMLALPSGHKPRPFLESARPLIAAWARDVVDGAVGAGRFKNAKAAIPTICREYPWTEGRYTPSTFQKLYTAGGADGNLQAFMGWLEFTFQPPPNLELAPGSEAWRKDRERRHFAGNRMVNDLIAGALRSEDGAQVFVALTQLLRHQQSNPERTK